MSCQVRQIQHFIHDSFIDSSLPVQKSAEFKKRTCRDCACPLSGMAASFLYCISYHKSEGTATYNTVPAATNLNSLASLCPSSVVTSLPISKSALLAISTVGKTDTHTMKVRINRQDDAVARRVWSLCC